MQKDKIINFVKDFNKSSRSIGDFIRIAKSVSLSIDELGEPIEIDNKHIWSIPNTGRLIQCVDCKYMEFVDEGEQPKNVCNSN